MREANFLSFLFFSEQMLIEVNVSVDKSIVF